MVYTSEGGIKESYDGVSTCTGDNPRAYKARGLSPRTDGQATYYVFIEEQPSRQTTLKRQRHTGYPETTNVTYNNKRS